MKISAAVLRRYTTIPEDIRDLRELLDDVGIEVKRIEDSEVGTVLNLELLANRGDHACYTGVARELVGRTGAPLTSPETPWLDVVRTGEPPGDFPLALRCETELTLQYSGTYMIRTQAPGSLPAEVVEPLLAQGVHSISPAVDATNLSNLEFGQPTHVFDADTIVGAVVMRLASPGETCWPLFQEERVAVPEGAVVIADDQKILAVAGVIGCQESKVTDTTTRVLVESATFDPVSVRKTSRAMGIQTDSSSRFERGADPDMCLVGAARVVDLLERYDGFQRVGATQLVGSWTDPQRQIPLEIPRAAAYLEYPLTADEVRERLQRYGFRVSSTYPWSEEEGWRPTQELLDQFRDRLRMTVLVQVPPGRLWDVEFPDDLVEELAKSIGYNNTPTSLPPVDLGALPSRTEAIKHRVEDVLVGLGFFEVFTDGFYARTMRELLGLEEGHPLWEHVEVTNALDRGYSLLKNQCLGQAVEAVAANLRMRSDEVKAYEWTRTFHPDAAAPNGVCTERSLLWMVSSGHATPPDWRGGTRPADAWFLKGVLEEIGVELGLPLGLGPSAGHPLSAALHPGRQAAITLNGKVVGVLGQVHPEVCKRLRIPRARPTYMEIELEAILTEGTSSEYTEPDEQHPILRDLAFTLPHGVQAGDVAHQLLSSGPAWLRRVDIVDLYEHQEDGKPVRTVTFALDYANEGNQRTADEVNAASEYLIEVVEKRFGDRGVKLRA